MRLQLSPKLIYRSLPYVSALFIGLWLVSLGNRQIGIDDAWLAEQAYWLAKEGHVRSNLFEGLIHYEVSQLMYHKLFIWQGATVISLAGWDVYILKSISLLYFLLFLFLFYRYLIQQKFKPSTRWLAIVIIFSSPLIFEYSFMFRPELMLMTTGFGVYLLLKKALEKNDWRIVLAAGFVAGICTLIHLNGLIFGVAGFIAIVSFKQYKQAFLFGCVFTIVSTACLANVHSLEEWRLFVYQFKNDPALSREHFKPIHYFIKLLEEHKRFFHSIEEVAFSGLLIIAIGFNWNRIKNRRLLLIFTITLIASLGLLSHGKTVKYMLLYFPYLVLILLYTLPGLLRDAIGIVALAGYLIINFIFCIDFVRENSNEVAAHARVAEQVGTRGKKVATRLQFIFHEIEHTQIQSLIAYKYFNMRGMYFGKEHFDFFHTAALFNIDIVLANKEDLPILQAGPLSTTNMYGDYQYEGEVEGFHVFRKQN